MKKKALKILGLNKKSVSNLNLLGGAAPASGNTHITCPSCRRSCLPCSITLADED